MPMPALVSSMPMPSYGVLWLISAGLQLAAAAAGWPSLVIIHWLRAWVPRPSSAVLYILFITGIVQCDPTGVKVVSVDKSHLKLNR
jgi:hypothetical protein